KSISRLTARVSRFNPQARSEIGSGFRLATRRSRTLSAESTLNISLTFSKATVISGAIGSRRSSLRACATEKPFHPVGGHPYFSALLHPHVSKDLELRPQIALQAIHNC